MFEFWWRPGGGGFSGKSLVVGGVGVGERSERGGFWSVVFSGSWVMKGFERALFSSSLSSSSSSSVFPSSPTHSLSAPPPLSHQSLSISVHSPPSLKPKLNSSQFVPFPPLEPHAFSFPPPSQELPP